MGGGPPSERARAGITRARLLGSLQKVKNVLYLATHSTCPWRTQVCSLLVTSEESIVGLLGGAQAPKADEEGGGTGE